jgi:DNA-binding beta-propeller fold protein YncE
MKVSVIALALVAGLAAHADAQFVMMADSTNNRMVLFDPTDGSLVNGDFFALEGGTTVHAMQVGNEIWVSEQIGDRISRWDFEGSSLGAITGGLDNIRGMGRIGNTVYVTNSGTNNGAPGNSVVMFDTAGSNMGFFATAGLAPSPFGILAYQGGMLVSSSSANDDIHHFDLEGASIGTFHNSAGLNFAEQMTYASNGDILVAGFSSNNIARLDSESGDIISSFAASGARGVYQLGNGNIMWTSGAGVFIHDVNTGGSTQVYAGGGRYLDFLNIPTPGVLPMLGLGGMLGARRRR